MTYLQRNFTDTPEPKPIDSRYKSFFKCDCGERATYRMPVRVSERPYTETSGQTVYNANLYLCDACLEKERRQQQGYRQ